MDGKSDGGEDCGGRGQLHPIIATLATQPAETNDYDNSCYVINEGEPIILSRKISIATEGVELRFSTTYSYRG